MSIMVLMQKVWMVDDEELLGEICAETLRESFETRCFSSAAAVLEALQTEAPPDVFLSDLRMPGMTGIQLLAELRRRKIGKPFLIVSGFADKESALEALSLGAFAMIEKPFHPVALLHTVSKAAAYGELMEMTDSVIANFQALHDAMNALLKMSRERYIAAENQLGSPVPQGDRERLQKFLAAMVAETKLEEVAERTAKDIAATLARRERLLSVVKKP